MYVNLNRTSKQPNGIDQCIIHVSKLCQEIDFRHFQEIANDNYELKSRELVI
jgi:hypothetical protein